MEGTMGYVDKWSELARLRSPDGQVVEPQKQGEIICFMENEPEVERKNEMIFTIAVIRVPSELEKEKGVGEILLAGPSAIVSVDLSTALVQFGAANAEVLKTAPAGLIKVAYRDGV